MQLQVIDRARQERVPWRNGRGFTTNVCSDAPAGTDEWTWRVSVAEVPERAPFSVFPGVDRQIMCIAGQGMHLRVAGAERHLAPDGPALAFAGEDAAEGWPVGPGVRDMNLMVRRELWSGQLWRAEAGERIEVAPGARLVVLAAWGGVTCEYAEETVRLAMGDAACLRAPFEGPAGAPRELLLREGNAPVALAVPLLRGP